MPGSFRQTPGPKEEVKVRGKTVLTNGITKVTPSPEEEGSHSHDEGGITRSGDVSKEFPILSGIPSMGCVRVT